MFKKDSGSKKGDIFGMVRADQDLHEAEKKVLCG